MAIPSECKMPNLSGLDFPLMGRLCVQEFAGERDLSPKAILYRKVFIRLVDKALREYYEARKAIIAQIAEANRSAEEMITNGRQIYMFEFIDHTETCINAVRRLYKLLERIKAEKESPVLPKELREMRRLVEK